MTFLGVTEISNEQFRRFLPDFDARFYYGTVTDDFSPWANLADRSFAMGHRPDGSQVTGGVDHLLLEGAELANRNYDDDERPLCQYD